ncbi:ribose 5-phosphate isomerase B [bacterium]|nr:ribose 5-phosphate isomerase B [bacterium]
MRIAIGSDHAGYALKEEVKAALKAMKHDVEDCGCFSTESSDYPDAAQSVAKAVQAGAAERGVLVCSTGIGISIAANRHPGVRAALCFTCDMAERAREHNDANVICFGARQTQPADARAMLEAFLATPFSREERHRRRIGKIDCPATGEGA